MVNHHCAVTLVDQAAWKSVRYRRISLNRKANLPIKIMMEGQLHELLRILYAEREVFLKCLEGLSEQQQRLVENGGNSSRRNQGNLIDLDGQVADLETRRNDIIDSISRKPDLGPGDNTVGQLLDSLKGCKFVRLERLKRTIMDAFEGAEKQRRHNDSIIRKSLDIIRETANESSQSHDCSTVDNEAAESCRPATPDGNRRLVGSGFTEATRAENRRGGLQRT